MSRTHLNAHQRGLVQAFSRARLTERDLWLRYFALGGDLGPSEVDAYLHGLRPLPELEHNILALAVNDRLRELSPGPRAPYY
jgi:hypothetical protein